MRNPQSLDAWARLRLRIAEEQHVLSRDSYHRLWQQFMALRFDVQRMSELTPEYDQQESLLNVDDKGNAVPFTHDTLDDFREAASQYPAIARWFQIARVAERDSQVLLVGRWLCHLVGIRHRTVQLFIDHPSLGDYTLIQVRGLNKVESPGCFDLPAAGHIAGTESLTATLFKELEEELNLQREDIEDLALIGHYEYRGLQDGSSVQNVELCTVFRSRLKPGRLPKIRFVDGEVAAISMFDLSELQALIATFPERTASGLRGSLPLYLQSRRH
jgi:isopentenyldiphosphate isomerase